ncbi:MAG TPA: alpha/beta hydrolase-fold protein [Polyangiales bacterium]|nr:alpha/beta hydrolase-fold protein [Polyangiales bacterium]
MMLRCSSWVWTSLLLSVACHSEDSSSANVPVLGPAGTFAAGGFGGSPLAAPAAGSGGLPAGAGAFAAGGAGASGGGAGVAAGSGGMMAAAGMSAVAGSSGSAAGSPAAGSCGTRMGMRGKTMRTVTVGSDKRTFIAYLPETASPTEPLPFVYVFHGANQTGQNLYDMTTYSKLADSEGIAVVFPDGQGVSSATSVASLTPWNVSDGGALCGLGAIVSNPNAVDFAFMDAMKLDLQQDQCLDPKHTYSTGFSMGGYMTHHIACDRTDIRAAAPHSGGTLSDLSACKTGHVPIIIFHGTADPLIAANCDDPKLSPDPSFVASATLWAKKNGCKATYMTIPANGTNGSSGSCYVYDDCPPDGQVEMCSFQDLPHAWAGAPVCPSCIGEGPNYASATQLQWDFFKKYAW